ncbi:hypothetical protein ACTNDN_18325 [Niallia sp. HCP3S3_B10]|uniref:hypothetical protein n=1 Tax=Niallia sp. HCP3S3_B10 TaxID=3438944 RepID=UPI003F8B1B69
MKYKKKVIRKLEDLEGKERPTDSLLIREAEEFGLITKAQKIKLEHMKTMRGVYAHPLNNAPTKLEVEVAIELGVTIVLSQPPLLKHAFVKELAVAIFENHHYLDDNSERVTDFAENTLQHVNPSVFPYFFKLLIENLNRINGDITKEIFFRRGKLFLNALLKKAIDSDVSIEDWKVSDLLHNYSNIMAKTFIDEMFWPLLNETLQDSIIGYLIEPIKEGKVIKPSIESIEKILNLHNHALLNQRHLERLNTALEKCSPYYKMSAGVPLEWYQNELIFDLKSRNWYQQNPVIDVLVSLGKEKINQLESQFLIELGRNLLQAADGGARDVKDFILSLGKKNQWSSFLIEGVFLETFVNEKNKIRFKRHFQTAFMAVLALQKDDRERIFNNAIELLKISSAKTWITEKSFDKIIGHLQDIVQKANESDDSNIIERREIILNFTSTFEETKDRILAEEEEEE